MIPVQQALEIILKQVPRLPVISVPIEKASGYVLAEEVYSDINMPPFNKSSMDGYALKAEDTQKTPAELQVVGFIPAGKYPDFKIQAGQAAKIMTGAPVPEGADSVQMVEKTEPIDDHRVQILESIETGKNISWQGEIIQEGQKVLSNGTFISPAVIGVLATVGKTNLAVIKKPSVSILVTGDELVPVNQKPGPGQIRNSNGFTLYHQLLELGITAEIQEIAADNLDDLTAKIQKGLESDVLLITGGVSMGDLDLVEDVFTKLGLKIYFNKVKIKPGKPTVFARHKNAVVFGLPGNPVSAATVFEVLVKPALY
ncbi:MAG: molybdopterin molybdenumtransferase MoeA, partial [Calditrichaeota bacterium]